ncbi:MAG: glycosyltransferase family 2 protein [Acidobacteriota bacterium]
MKIAAVIVNYNAKAFIQDCVASIQKQTRPLDRIIVVDNASTDGSLDALRAVAGIELILNTTNIGFAPANNQAVDLVRDSHVLCCNADLVLEPTFLERCLRAIDGDQATGMITGKILRFDRRTIDSTGQFLSASRWPKERGYGEINRGQYDRDGPVFSVCAACALYRREMIDQISDERGFFDRRYFAFYEDLDVGWRAQRAGWGGAYVHDAVAYHFRGGVSGAGRFSFTRKSPEIRFHVLKNRYLTISKNDRPLSFILHLPAIIARDAVLLGYTALTTPAVLWRLARYFGGGQHRT